MPRKDEKSLIASSVMWFRTYPPVVTAVRGRLPKSKRGLGSRMFKWVSPKKRRNPQDTKSQRGRRVTCLMIGKPLLVSEDRAGLIEAPALNSHREISCREAPGVAVPNWTLGQGYLGSDLTLREFLEMMLFSHHMDLPLE
jgi:hypothetical protein